jgi:thiol:disulfide interchange protein
MRIRLGIHIFEGWVHKQPVWRLLRDEAGLTMKRKMLIAALVLPIIAGAAWGATAPRLTLAATDTLPVVERTPYAENADAEKAVNAAFARARKNGKRVLIDLGGNWCGDCIVLANIMQLAEMKPFIAAHFEVVTVDVGRFDKNLSIPARFGITQRLEGVPSVIVAEPDGRFVNAGHIAALADARHMTPQAIADWLAQWAK